MVAEFENVDANMVNQKSKNYLNFECFFGIIAINTGSRGDLS